MPIVSTKEFMSGISLPTSPISPRGRMLNIQDIIASAQPKKQGKIVSTKEFMGESGFFPSIVSGARESATGAIFGAEPAKYAPEGMMETIGHTIGQYVPDLPLYKAGAEVGGMAGLAIGGPLGAILGAGAGAFALPALLKGAIREDDPAEVAKQVGKSALVGSLTAGAGRFFTRPLAKYVTGLEPITEFPSPAARLLGISEKTAGRLRVPAELGTLVTAQTAIEEGRFPTGQEFVSGAIPLAVLHIGMKGVKKIGTKLVGPGGIKPPKKEEIIDLTEEIKTEVKQKPPLSDIDRIKRVADEQYEATEAEWQRISKVQEMSPEEMFTKKLIPSIKGETSFKSESIARAVAVAYRAKNPTMQVEVYKNSDGSFSVIESDIRINPYTGIPERIRKPGEYSQEDIRNLANKMIGGAKPEAYTKAEEEIMSIPEYSKQVEKILKEAHMGVAKPTEPVIIEEPRMWPSAERRIAERVPSAEKGAAFEAVRAGTATPEQEQLVVETMKLREKITVKSMMAMSPEELSKMVERKSELKEELVRKRKAAEIPTKPTGIVGKPDLQPEIKKSIEWWDALAKEQKEKLSTLTQAERNQAIREQEEFYAEKFPEGLENKGIDINFFGLQTVATEARKFFGKIFGGQVRSTTEYTELLERAIKDRAAKAIKEQYPTFEKLPQGAKGEINAKVRAARTTPLGTNDMVMGIPVSRWSETMQRFLREPTSTIKELISGYNKLADEGMAEMRVSKDIDKLAARTSWFNNLAKKYPQFKPVYDIGVSLERLTNRSISNFTVELQPYLRVENQKNMDRMLIKARQADKSHTDNELRLEGLGEAEIAGYRSALKTMTTAKTRLRLHLIKMGNDPAKVDAFIKQLPIAYVPARRFGEYYVRIPEINWRSHHDSPNEAAKVVREARAKLGKDVLIQTGKNTKLAPEAYEGIPPNILSLLAQFDKELGVELSSKYAKVMGKGFPQHLIKAEEELVAGFEQNLLRPITDYIISISRYIHSREAKVEFAKALKGIDPVNLPNLYGTAKRYADYLLNPPREYHELRRFMFNYYIGGIPKSAAIDATQPLTMTLPALSRYTKHPNQVFLKSLKTAIMPIEKIFATDRHLGAALTGAVRDGVIEPHALHNMKGTAFGHQEGWYSKALSFFYSTIETFNAKHAFIAGWEASKGKMPHATFQERVKFAEDFIIETQAFYSRATKPEIARGIGAPLLTFRLFPYYYLNFLKQMLYDGEFKALAKALGVAITLGGATTLPFIADTAKVLEALGYNPKQSTKEAMGQYGDLFLYGPAFSMGWDISGSMAPATLPRDVSGTKTAIASAVLGVPLDMIDRVGMAHLMLTKYKDPARAVEALSPEFIRNAQVAARWYKTGEGTTPRGEPLFKAEVPQVVGKVFGFQPARATLAYERESAERRLQQKENISNIYNMKIAKAMKDGNPKKMADIWDEIITHNKLVKLPEDMIVPTRNGIKTHLIRMTSPRLVEEKSLPKAKRKAYQKIQELYQEEEGLI